MRKETTQKELEEFKAYCEKWIKFFGLLDWKVYYEIGKLTNANACFRFDLIGRVATLTLGAKVDFPFELDRIALHEVVEGLLIGKIRYMAICRGDGYSKDDIEEEGHRITRILENVLLENLK